MNRSEFDNNIRKQIMSLPELVNTQLAECFGEKLKNLMTMAEIFDTRRIILTGCGDSYAAAITMAPVIERYCDCFGVKVMRTIEFTRFLEKKDIGIGEPNSPLVIAISASGNSARICEALQKANEVEAFSILMTNNPVSKAAKIAKRVYTMGTPVFPNDFPGLRSYFASLIGLIALASRYGHVRGTLPPTTNEDFQTAIISYITDYADKMERIDQQMFALAQKWSNFSKFDFIGDNQEYGSALFSAAKFIECCGSYATAEDSEDWCHINYFLRDASQTGTIVMANPNAPSFGRIRETIASAAKIGRPVLVVSSADPEIFHSGAEVCQLPSTPKGYEWLQPLMDYIPAALLSGYHSVLQNESFFRRYTSSDGEVIPNNPFANPDCYTLNTSNIEIYY